MTKPMIAIWSLFRDDGYKYVKDYYDRVSRLDYPWDRIRLYLGEGDSTDDTAAAIRALCNIDHRISLIWSSTGIPRTNTTSRPDRLKTLAQAGNRPLEAINLEHRDTGIEFDYALFLESDLLFEPDLLNRLIDRIPDDAGVLAPMVWYGQDGPFYDTWGFRTMDFAESGLLAEETGIGRFPAWNRGGYEKNRPSEPYPVASAGSCFLTRWLCINQGARYTDQEAIIGYCRTVRENNWGVYVDPQTHITHPLLTQAQWAQSWRHT